MGIGVGTIVLNGSTPYLFNRFVFFEPSRFFDHEWAVTSCEHGIDMSHLGALDLDEFDPGGS